jgi:hypothetical protein
MTVSVKNRKWIDTAVVLLLDTKQKYYKFRIKGERKLALAVGQE